jgi:hypothetical protein
MYEKYALFYKPACGEWYVHSHKLYDTKKKAEAAAHKFLMPGQVYAIKLISFYPLEMVSQTI